MESPLLSSSEKTSRNNSITEWKSRTNSVDNPIMVKTQRVYPQLTTMNISHENTREQLSEQKINTPIKSDNDTSSKKETTGDTSPKSDTSDKHKKKDKIPKALREQVWLHYSKKEFEVKCPITWCQNKITPFSFHVGHNIPETNGGTIDIGNLRPICANCNLSMGSKFTIDEWNKIAKHPSSTEIEPPKLELPLPALMKKKSKCCMM
jgi:hypothetical protein